VRRGEREVRDARQTGLEAVDDVESPSRQREPEVRPDGDGNADVRASGERDRRTDGDDLGIGSSLERSATREEVPSA